ncbi:MAG TPA: hypothetical protein VGZ25_08170 [Gemmataceae bacterium]|jgi:hypothetical protein|nr:hypothetical protein [Gemmataceae bacterium]
MNEFLSEMNRRGFLRASASAVGASSLQNAIDAQPTEPKGKEGGNRKKLAVVTTAYYYLSHAYHVCGRFLYGYLQNGKLHKPEFGIAAMFVEQTKPNDLSRELSKKHGFKLSPDIATALTLGGDKLAVDGVLLIGEHGIYPYNAKGQKLYPRFEMFQKIVEVFEKSKSSVPVFCDKHLSYDRKKAGEMVETARRIGFPLYAGSSLPITWRRPEVELPLGVKIEEAVVVSRGELEIYGIHSLEALQCMVERRLKGQQGVKTVTYLEGDAVWKAGDNGVWSWSLVDHALSRSPSRNCGDMRENCRQYAQFPERLPLFKGPTAFVIEYRDGLKATVLTLNGHTDDTTFAARTKGEKKPVSTLFYLPAPPGAAFLEALTTHIEKFMHTGKPPYPIERTLLTGGILDYALESRFEKGKRLETKDLAVDYEPPLDSGFMRGDHTY